MTYEQTIYLVHENVQLISNRQEPFDYMRYLFYPNGANGIYLDSPSDEAANLKVYTLYLDALEVEALQQQVRESWKPTGQCRPMSEGTYDMYEQEGAQAFIQDVNDHSSRAHFNVRSERELFIVSSLGKKLDSKVLSRLLREMAMRRLESQGYIIFHASLVDLDGKGIVVIGNSGAGKTTLALSLCKFGGAKFISNDRVMIKKLPDGGFSAIPFSFAARMNYGTLKTLGVEQEYLTWNLFNTKPSDQTDWRTFNGDIKLHMLPKELETLFGIGVGKQTSPCAIILPGVAMNHADEGIEPTLDEELLRMNCYSPSDPDFMEDWLQERSISTAELQYFADETLHGLLELTTYKFRYTFEEYRKYLEQIIEQVTSVPVTRG